jgi:hypothetical protein
MMSNSFSDTRLPWYEIIVRPPEVSLFITSETGISAAADTEPGPSDEDWVTRAVSECYNG